MDSFQKDELVERVQGVVIRELEENYRTLVHDEALGVEIGADGVLEAAHNRLTPIADLDTLLRYGEAIVAAVQANPAWQQQGQISG